MKFQVATPHQTAIVGDGELGNEQRTLFDRLLDQSSFVDTAPDADSLNINEPHGIGLADGKSFIILKSVISQGLLRRKWGILCS